MHGIGRQEPTHQEKDVIEEIAERQRSEDRRKKNESWKYRQNKVIRQRGRHLQCMVAHYIAISRAESLLDTADAHRPTIVLETERVNTEITVCRGLWRQGLISLLSGVVHFQPPHLNAGDIKRDHGYCHDAQDSKWRGNRFRVGNE